MHMNNPESSTKMTVIPDSGSNNHSPRSGGFSDDTAMKSPQSRRRNSPSQWAQVVRGENEEVQSVDHPLATSPPPVVPVSSPEPILAAEDDPAESCDGEGDGGSNVGNLKRQAWKKPSNGGVVEVSPVMGAADAWPALSESTKPSPRSLKPVSEELEASILQGPVTSHSPHKVVSNPNPNSTVNHTLPVRQRSMKRGGGSNGPGPNHAHPPPPPTPPRFPVEIHQNSFGHLVPPVVPTHSPRNNWEPRHMGGFIPQPHMVNDHHMQRNGPRRGNFGHHHRGGDGAYNNRRDQDRGNFMWSSPRGSNAVDVHMGPLPPPPQRPLPRNFPRAAPPNAAQFIGPHLVSRPFANPLGYPEMPLLYYQSVLAPDHFTAMPVVHSPSGMFYQHPADPPLSTKIVNQIEYYFSDENLQIDGYLRQNMDDQGWVPITLIAGFPRVLKLTKDIQVILEALKTSTATEVQGDKIRKRNGWARWLFNYGRIPSSPGAQSPGGSTSNLLSTRLQELNLKEVTLPNGESPSQDTTQPPSNPAPTC